ncbi:uroporphyrinogen-III synthase [Oceanobacillus damuensis]|uniref:uroporphyrinogen-III synthase n=1 Tax=Oceanobacillus damuensis TaxID=937928 RepID=UPI000833C6F6|nr:uroporphyrinogen-III synthase [Oceanobacillus damuensis]
MDLSLHGCKVLITREAKQANVLAEKLAALGGIPVTVPLLRISCKDAKENQQILAKIQTYTWIFFTSANGVDCFFRLTEKYHVHTFGQLKFATVGQKTEQALNAYGYQTSFVPSTYNAENMAKEFGNEFSEEGPVLLIRGNRSRDVLPVEFSKKQLAFDSMEVYETSVNNDAKEELNQILSKDDIDFITFTSPSTVEAFLEMAEAIPEKNIVCIGTTTEQRARELGFSAIITPHKFTTESMLEAISNYINRKEGSYVSPDKL